jgi:Ca-activated chloride channel family protein
VPLLGGAHWTERNDSDVSEGQEAFHAGDYTIAVERFRSALAGEGERARLHFDLGTAQIQLSSSKSTEQEREQELDLAIVSLRSANASQGTALREMVDYNLASALVLRGRFEDAIVVYRRLLIQNPDHDDARYNLELALLAMRSQEAGDKRLADRLRGIVVAKPEGSTGAAAGTEPNGMGAGQPDSHESTGQPNELDAGPLGEAASESGAGTERAGAQSESSSSSGAEGEGDAKAKEEESPSAPAQNSLPPSTSKLSLKKKLDALERRSAELRRASIMRKTTSRVRNPDKRAKDQ